MSIRHIERTPNRPYEKPLRPGETKPWRLARGLKRLRINGRALAWALATAALASSLAAQTPAVPTSPKYTIEPFGKSKGNNNPVTQPTLSPGVLTLLELEGRFAQDVAASGGKAFVKWFAEDAVTLNNGLPPVVGRTAIAAQAQWDPKQYQLTWIPQGAQMGPSNDMGFTWGHYEGHSTDKAGQPITKTGRYMTVWKRQPNGDWKVAMDASADEPAGAGECCALPKP